VKPLEDSIKSEEYQLADIGLVKLMAIERLLRSLQKLHIIDTYLTGYTSVWIQYKS
jgi:hypothetical protein